MGRIADVSEVMLELGLTSSPSDAERAVLGEAVRQAEGAVRRHLRYDPVKAVRTEYYPQMDYDRGFGTRIWEVVGQQAVIRTVAEAATDELQVRHIPIRSVSNLYVDYDGRAGAKSGAFGSDTEKTEGTDFWPNYDGVDDDGNAICRDGIIRAEGTWPSTPGSVKIVYAAGYSPEELRGQKDLVDASPIWEAVVHEAARRVKRAFAVAKKTGAGLGIGLFTSERLGDYSYSADAGSIKKLFLNVSGLTSDSVDMLEPFVNWGWCLGP